MPAIPSETGQRGACGPPVFGNSFTKSLDFYSCHETLVSCNPNVESKFAMASISPRGNVRALVLGSGFAGLQCCQKLTDPGIQVTLLDRENHHLFQPLLYQVATASLAAPDIAAPIREILRRRDNVQVFMEKVTKIDLENRRVHTRSRTHDYDYLVIALGARTSYFGNAHWEEHAPGLKSLDDARQLRHRVLQSIEEAEVCADPEERRRLLTIIIVGGGPTGVELAGAFTELVHRALKDGFRNVRTQDLDVILLEAAPRLLGMFEETLSEYAKERLAKLGIDVRTGTMVKDIAPGKVTLEDSVLHAANIIWTAGTEANPITADMDVEKDKAGRLMVKPDCSLEGHPEVFAIGDIAHCEDKNGVFVPQLAAAAGQMGKHVAKLIQEEVRMKRRGLEPKPPAERRPFAYFDKGIMAIIGKSAAVAQSKVINVRGFVAWLAWLFIHLIMLVGFRNKLTVLLQWAFAYIRGKRGSRIITSQDEDRLKNY